MEQPILIFDFDGTIADTHLYLCQISNLLSKEFQFNAIELTEINLLKEKSAQEIITYLKIPVFKIPAIIAKGKEEFGKGLSKIKPFEGLKDVLLKLKSQKVKIGILSSNSTKNVMQFLQNHEMDIFDFVYTTAMIWSKNTSLKKMMQDQQLSKNNVIYVGDEIRDINAAKKIGVKVAAVSWGYNTSVALEQYSPDYLIRHPEELLKLIYCR